MVFPEFIQIRSLRILPLLPMVLMVLVSVRAVEYPDQIRQHDSALLVDNLTVNIKSSIYLYFSAESQ